jgi:hypothetical protein
MHDVAWPAARVRRALACTRHSRARSPSSRSDASACCLMIRPADRSSSRARLPYVSQASFRARSPGISSGRGPPEVCNGAASAERLFRLKGSRAARSLLSEARWAFTSRLGRRRTAWTVWSPSGDLVVSTGQPPEILHEKLLVWKRNGQLRALDLRGYESRNKSVLRLLEEADSMHDLPEFSPVMVHTGDTPINASGGSWRSLAFTSANGYADVAVPDFLFDGWPEVGIDDYEEASATVAAAAAAEPGAPQLGWIGNCDTHPSRRLLLRLGEQHPDLFDVHHVSWMQKADTTRLASAANNHLSLDEQVRRWWLLFDIEGRGYSARLKLLLHSGRPVLIQERPWREWFWAGLRPMEHFIPVRRDLSDLVDRVRWAREYPDDAARIGAAGRDFARTRLRRADAVREWARILRTVADQPDMPYAPRPQRRILDRVLAQVP